MTETRSIPALLEEHNGMLHKLVQLTERLVIATGDAESANASADAQALTALLNAVDGNGALLAVLAAEAGALGERLAAIDESLKCVRGMLAEFAR